MTVLEHEFDASQVLTLVYQGQAPATWQIFPVQKSWLIERGASFLLVTLLAILGLILCAVGFNLQSTGTIHDSWFLWLLWFVSAIFSMLLFVSICVTWFYFWSLRISYKQVVVVTPTGVVCYPGYTPWQHDAFAFANLLPTKIIIDHPFIGCHVSLYLPFKGQPFSTLKEWGILPRFAPEERIAQAIVEAHQQYWTQQASQQKSLTATV